MQCCGRDMSVAGTAGQGMGDIVSCSYCGRRSYNRPDNVLEFRARVLEENLRLAHQGWWQRFLRWLSPWPRG